MNHHTSFSGRHLVALVGPTAGAKTAVALRVAREMDVEVISADSRQVRAGMVIGTAAPTEAERAAAPHHLVGIVEPGETFTLVDWLERAREALDGIWARGRLPLVVGGTGQYVWALLEGWQVPRVPPNPELRAALHRMAEAEGPAALHARLAAVDPASAERIAERNVLRVVRALEIIETTGEPIPPLERQAPDFSWETVGLRWEREESFRRVDERVVAMFEGGLIEETQGLLERYGDRFRALRTIGYQQALDVIDGRATVAEAIERTQLATHRLVRTQGNWFPADDPRIAWWDGRDEAGAVGAIVAAASAPVR